METTARHFTWRLVIAPVVAIALAIAGVVFVASKGHAHRGAHAVHSRHFDADDLLLAAIQAKKGVFFEWDGITGAPSTDHTNHPQLTSFAIGITRSSTINNGTRELGPPKVGNITITRVSDKYSAPLMNQALRSDGSANAIIYFTNLTA